MSPSVLSECYSELSPECELREIVFILRFGFNIIISNTRVLTANFTTAFASRSIEWFIDVSSDRNSPVAKISQRRLRTDETFPQTSCRMKFVAYSEDCTRRREAVESSTTFTSIYTPQMNGLFSSKAHNILHDEQYEGGEMIITVELKFIPENFFASQEDPRRPFPVMLMPDDFRIKNLVHMSQQRDFTINAKDGEILTSKYLLYLSLEFFHSLLNNQSSINSVNLNFERGTINKVINFAFKGIFDLYSDEIDQINKFLKCIKALKPLQQQKLIDFISDMLSDRLRKDWNEVKLDEVVKMLDISYEYHLVNLFDAAMNLIVDQHYADFKIEYSEYAEGEKSMIYRRLSRSEVTELLAPTNILAGAYKKRKNVPRILKYDIKRNIKREIICE